MTQAGGFERKEIRRYSRGLQFGVGDVAVDRVTNTRALSDGLSMKASKVQTLGFWTHHVDDIQKHMIDWREDFVP